MYNGNSRLGGLPEAERVDLLLRDLMPDFGADDSASAESTRQPSTLVQGTLRGAMTLRSFLDGTNWQNRPHQNPAGYAAAASGTGSAVRGAATVGSFFGSVNWRNEAAAAGVVTPASQASDHARMLVGVFMSEFNWD
jgi:hypothetical protein